jgi:GABA permease
MWLFPYLTWVAIISIVALLIGMVILESTRESLVLSLALAAIVVGLGVFRYRKNGSKATVPAAGDAEAPADAPAEAQADDVKVGHAGAPAEEATVGGRPTS